MEQRDLSFPAGYDPRRQKLVGTFAAQLDNELEKLNKLVSDLAVEQLQRQFAPGRNSIGMLIAHNAMVEVFWVNVAAAGMRLETGGEEVIRRTIGIVSKDDGMPLPPDGRHPEALAGKTAEEYLAMMAAARRVTHATLQQWSDDDLGLTYIYDDRQFSRRWTVYHVLEHFISHLGQIRMLKNMMA